MSTDLSSPPPLIFRLVPSVEGGRIVVAVRGEGGEIADTLRLPDLAAAEDLAAMLRAALPLWRADVWRDQACPDCKAPPGGHHQSWCPTGP